MKAALCLMVAVLLTATSCNKKSQDESQARATASEVASAAAPGPQASVADVASDDSDLDLPEDFADDAAEEVTAANLDVQFSAVEKEVTAAN